jgi:hypothetical protein
MFFIYRVVLSDYRFSNLPFFAIDLSIIGPLPQENYRTIDYLSKESDNRLSELGANNRCPALKKT